MFNIPRAYSHLIVEFNIFVASPQPSVYGNSHREQRSARRETFLSGRYIECHAVVLRWKRSNIIRFCGFEIHVTVARLRGTENDFSLKTAKT